MSEAGRSVVCGKCACEGVIVTRFGVAAGSRSVAWGAVLVYL